jgi:hypothetical protein
VAGIILTPWNLLGNELLKMKFHHLPPLHINFNLLQLLKRNSVVSFTQKLFLDILLFCYFSEQQASV